MPGWLSVHKNVVEHVGHLCGQCGFYYPFVAVCPLCQPAACAQFPGVTLVVIHDVLFLCRFLGGVENVVIMDAAYIRSSSSYSSACRSSSSVVLSSPVGDAVGASVAVRLRSCSCNSRVWYCRACVIGSSSGGQSKRHAGTPRTLAMRSNILMETRCPLATLLIYWMLTPISRAIALMLVPCSSISR